MIARIVTMETMKECNSIDISCKKILTHGEAKSRGGGNEDENNVVLLTFVVQRGQCRAAR